MSLLRCRRVFEIKDCAVYEFYKEFIFIKNCVSKSLSNNRENVREHETDETNQQLMLL